MKHNARSLRPFIGAKDFDVSRSFYRDLGFEEKILSPDMSVFNTGALSFYLQKAYVKDWVDNSMIFLEVDDVVAHRQMIGHLNLPAKYPGVLLSAMRYEAWGTEYFLHDPSGILWHFGNFKK